MKRQMWNYKTDLRLKAPAKQMARMYRFGLADIKDESDEVKYVEDFWSKS